MPQLLNYLTFHFKTNFDLADLTKTIRAKSIIRYPDVLKGKPLFYILPPAAYTTPLTFFQKTKMVLQSVSAESKWRFELTEDVKAFLRGAYGF